MGQIFERFEIKTGLRQGDGVSPFLSNCVLEKVIDVWRKEKTVQKLDQPFKFYDLASHTRDIRTAQNQVDLLEETAEKIGLQI